MGTIYTFERKIRMFFLVIFWLSIGAFALVANEGKNIYRRIIFDLYPGRNNIGTRVWSMGGTYAANTSDSSAIWLNPASLSYVDHKQIYLELTNKFLAKDWAEEAFKDIFRPVLIGTAFRFGNFSSGVAFIIPFSIYYGGDIYSKGNVYTLSLPFAYNGGIYSVGINYNLSYVREDWGSASDNYKCNEELLGQSTKMGYLLNIKDNLKWGLVVKLFDRFSGRTKNANYLNVYPLTVRTGIQVGSSSSNRMFCFDIQYNNWEEARIPEITYCGTSIYRNTLDIYLGFEKSLNSNSNFRYGFYTQSYYIVRYYEPIIPFPSRIDFLTFGYGGRMGSIKYNIGIIDSNLIGWLKDQYFKSYGHEFESEMYRFKMTTLSLSLKYDFKSFNELLFSIFGHE